MAVRASQSGKVPNTGKNIIFLLSFFYPSKVIAKLKTNEQPSHDARVRINTKKKKISPDKFFLFHVEK